MTVRERLLTIQLMEMMKKDPDYAERLGITIAEKTFDTSENDV